MTFTDAFSIMNGETVPFNKVPCLPFEQFQKKIIDAIGQKSRICSFFGMKDGNGNDAMAQLRLVAVVAQDSDRRLQLLSTTVEDSFPSFTPLLPQLHMFEREIAEQWGVNPVGHPWLRPVRCQSSVHKPEFFHIEGGEAHEVAVGPVHAGVIEPGHFRFQCHGEKVFHLEISLGYQHRGIERALIGGPHKKTPYQMETLAGDTTIGHYLAYCQIFESLQGIKVSPGANAIRAIGLELERLANHTGDLGALGGDVGYLPTSSYCGRIRGDFLNMTALLCGSRMGRGLLCPGGVRFDLDSPERVEKLTKALKQAQADTKTAIQLLWDTPSVMTRFENTGRVSAEDCRALGLVGPAARACGIFRDIRQDFPTGQYLQGDFPATPPMEFMTGDVAARAMIRWHEIQDSLRFLLKLVPDLPAGLPEAAGKESQQAACRPDSIAVSLVEGWRGEVCHTAITDAHGKFLKYKVVDPSFHNWTGLAMALRNQEISDFPLCNKSFNLSYCGFDL